MLSLNHEDTNTDLLYGFFTQLLINDEGAKRAEPFVLMPPYVTDYSGIKIYPIIFVFLMPQHGDKNSIISQMFFKRPNP